MGAVLIGQSGGPTAVINSSLAGAISAAREKGKKIYGMRFGIEGFLKGQYVSLDDRIKSDSDIELLKRTPAAYLGSCRYKLPPLSGENYPVYEDILGRAEELDVELICYNGGNDSMDTIARLFEYGRLSGRSMRFMGIPKTIDNDLKFCDHTPGFGSAAKYVAASIKEVMADGNALAYSNRQVLIFETMGRNAGWLAAASLLARGEDCDGPDLIYLPETVFDLDDFTERVREISERKRLTVVVVSEGIKLADGRFVSELGGTADMRDAFGHKLVSGIATVLANHISSRLKIKTRAIEPSSMQRGASHLASLQDINEAFECGCKAVNDGLLGESGKMISIKRISKPGEPYAYELLSHPAGEIANAEKKFPAEWIINDGSFVADAFIDYARPLIMGELTPVMNNGLPVHLRLN